jgi:hypothetical protein
LNGGHPSFYALDRARLGVPLDEGGRAHVAGCEACSAHLTLQQAPPPWLAQVPPRRRRTWTTVAALAVAAAVVFLVISRPDELREKGGPAVTVFVKRGEDVFVWDGAGRLRPNDRLRLQVASAGFDHVSVASLGEDRAPAVLYEGDLPAAPALLPLSFRVDEEGRRERLSVILGHRPIPPALHEAAKDDAQVWSQVLVFDKAPTPRSAP